MRQKISEGKSWYPPSYPQTFSISDIFRKTANKGSSTKCFGTVRQKNFEGKSRHNPLNHKIFRYQKFSETPKGSPTKFFGTVRQNNFDGKSWYPPPLLSLTFFDNRNFPKNRKVPRLNFSALWGKNFSTENRDTFLHKVQKLVVKLMFVKTLWKLISKQ